MMAVIGHYVQIALDVLSGPLIRPPVQIDLRLLLCTACTCAKRVFSSLQKPGEAKKCSKKDSFTL